MNPRVLALALVLALILFSGCVSIDFFHQVNRDGSSLIMQKIDFRNVPSDIYSSASPSELCGKIKSDNQGVDCVFEDRMMTLTSTVAAENDQYLFNRTLEFPYSIYEVEVRRTPMIINPNTTADIGHDVGEMSDFKDPSSKPTAAMLRAAGISMTYTIAMPGEIISLENGEKIVDDAGNTYARYDVLDLMTDGEYMIVTSKELDLVAIGIAIAAIGLFIGGIGVILVLRKAMEKKIRGGFGR